LWHLQKFLQYIKYFLIEFTFITPPPFLVWFHFCIYLHIFCTVFTLLPPFPTTSHLPLVPCTLPKQNMSCLPVLWFCRRKKWQLCLFEIKVATQCVSLLYLHVFMYYKPYWFISFLRVQLSGFMVLITTHRPCFQICSSKLKPPLSLVSYSHLSTWPL
jgi:hypothetical protein